MNKLKIFKKLIIFFSIVCFLHFIMIFSIKKLIDPVNFDDKTKNIEKIDIKTSDPNEKYFIDELKATHPSINNVEYTTNKEIKIKYNHSTHMSGNIELMDFALQSSKIIYELKNNIHIDKFSFYQDITLTNFDEIKNAIFVEFDKNSIQDINFESWIKFLKDHCNYTDFYAKSNHYVIYDKLLLDLSPEENSKLYK